MAVKVAFICVGNSARSQMAEGLARHLAGVMGLDVEVYSAGSRPFGYIHPLAIRVMREIGIDISNQRSKHLREIPLEEMDYVFVLCREEDCPFIPSKRVEHWNLPDPSVVGGDVERRLEAFRQIRDLLRKKIENFLRSLKG